MKIAELRKILGIDNAWIAKQLGFKNRKSYENTKAKKKYERFMLELYKKFKENE